MESSHMMVDWARINELREDLGEEDFDDVITMFLEEVEDHLGGLKSGNYNDLGEELHFLKGSAANLGFVRLNAACHAAEQTMPDCDLDEVHSIYATSKDEFLRKARAISA